MPIIFENRAILAPQPATSTSSQFRNWPSMYVAWLQGNSTNGADVTAGRQAIAKTDVAVMQGAWASKRATDYTNITAIKSIRSGIALGPYLDPCFWKDTAESSTDDYTRSVYDVVTAGNSNWRLRDTSGTGLAHRFAPANFRATNMAVHIAGTSGGLRFSEALADRMESDLNDGSGDRRSVYSFWGFDDMTPVDYPKYSGGSDATPDYDADASGDDPQDDTVPTGGGHKYRQGQAQFLTDFRAQFTNYAMFINTDLGLPYAQSNPACPVRPITSIETYQAADACLVENVFTYRFRIADHDTHSNDHIYPLGAAAGSSEGWMTLAVNEVVARTDAQSMWGKKMYAVYQNMAVNSSTSPTSADYDMARLLFAVCMSVEGAAYGAVMSGSDRPFWLDELAISFGNPMAARSMGTLDDSGAPVTFTLRSADFTGGSSEKFYWTEYQNALVVLRWDNVGITPGSSNLGDGSAVLCTLPSAGSGYRWDRFDATSYVNPTHSDLAMTSQDTTLNSGATNVTSVSLKPYGAIFLRRVAA